MKLISEDISINKFNSFIILSIFSSTLVYLILKGFVSNTELSDYIFSFSLLLFFEINYLFLINSKVKIDFNNKINFILYSLYFVLSFYLWIEWFNSSFYLISYFFLQIIIGIFLFYSHSYKTKDEKNYSLLLVFIIFSFLLSPLFYQLENGNYLDFIIILLLFFIYFLLAACLEKINFYVQLFLSLLIFYIVFKVFILSGLKDSFHYSYFLGPVYSYIFSENLLSNIASQYGYLNVYFVKNLAIITKLNAETILMTIISIFFIIFFLVFVKTINKIIRLPILIIIFFSSTLIFGLAGYSNLSGAMYIPSSSVFRFLPSILTIFYLTNLIKNKEKQIKKNVTLFLIFLTIGSLWSFESFIFIYFSLLGGFISLFLYYFLIKKDNIFFNFIKEKYLTSIIIFLFILIIPIYIILYNLFFLDYSIGLRGALSNEIEMSLISLLFIVFLFFNYCIVRISLTNKKNSNFLINCLWFSLFISFTSYYIIRSHPHNFFNLLSFFIFFVAILKIDSLNMRNIRIIFLRTLIPLVIISSLLSFYHNKELFLKNLFLNDYLKKPEYKHNNYKPNLNLKNVINKYDNLPLTLITGKTIHGLNNNLTSSGYGLPILPLEQFNTLSKKKRIKLMNIYFNKNPDHLILCLTKCNFYNEKIKKKNWESIFLPSQIEIKKLFNNKKESLYLLSLKK